MLDYLTHLKGGVARAFGMVKFGKIEGDSWIQRG